MMKRHLRRAIVYGAIVHLIDRAVREHRPSYSISELSKVLGVSYNTVFKYLVELDGMGIITLIRKEASNAKGFTWKIEATSTSGFYYRNEDGLKFTSAELFERHNTFINNNSPIHQRKLI